MLVPGNASSTAAPSVRSVSWRKRRKVASNPANGGDLREFQYLVLEPEFVLVMVERVSEVAERPAKATRHTFLMPEHTGARGLKIPQQERENHAAGKPRRWRQTTYQGHSQHKPRDPIQKRGPRRSSCLLSSRSRLAERKGEIAAAKDGTARYERRLTKGVTRATAARRTGGETKSKLRVEPYP